MAHADGHRPFVQRKLASFSPAVSKSCPACQFPQGYCATEINRKSLAGAFYGCKYKHARARVIRKILDDICRGTAHSHQQNDEIPTACNIISSFPRAKGERRRFPGAAAARALVLSSTGSWIQLLLIWCYATGETIKMRFSTVAFDARTEFVYLFWCITQRDSISCEECRDWLQQNHHQACAT